MSYFFRDIISSYPHTGCHNPSSSLSAFSGYFWPPGSTLYLDGLGQKSSSSFNCRRSSKERQKSHILIHLRTFQTDFILLSLAQEHNFPLTWHHSGAAQTRVAEIRLPPPENLICPRPPQNLPDRSVVPFLFPARNQDTFCSRARRREWNGVPFPGFTIPPFPS